MMQPEQNDDGMKEVKIGDKTFMVPTQMADAYAAQEVATEAKINSLAQKYENDKENLLSRINEMEVKPAEPAPNLETEGDDDEFWTDPQKVIDQRIKDAESRIESKLRQEYETASTEKAFWDDFYKSNKDLKDHKLIVDAVVARDGSKLAKMSLADAKTQIEEETRKEMLKLVPKQATNEEVVVESPTNSVDFDKPAPTEKKGPQSLSDIVKLRNQQRRSK